jgi:hypothetical protein
MVPVRDDTNQGGKVVMIPVRDGTNQEVGNLGSCLHEPTAASVRTEISSGDTSRICRHQ